MQKEGIDIYIAEAMDWFIYLLQQQWIDFIIAAVQWIDLIIAAAMEWFNYCSSLNGVIHCCIYVRFHWCFLWINPLPSAAWKIPLLYGQIHCFMEYNPFLKGINPCMEQWLMLLITVLCCGAVISRLLLMNCCSEKKLLWIAL